ncbi:MAG: serine hydrolase domain-containing protein [Sumerlaeia bacterium]
MNLNLIFNPKGLTVLSLFVCGLLLPSCGTREPSLKAEKASVRLAETAVGFAHHTFSNTDLRIKESIYPNGPIAAAVVSVSRNNLVVFEKAYGIDGEGKEIKREAIFDVASLTKPLVTASSVAWLVCEGRIDLSEKIAGYTVEECLRHETRLPETIDWKILNDRDLNLGLLTEILVELPPQTTAGYSNAAYVLLGALVEQRVNESLASVAERTIFSTLSMNSTSYLPNKDGVYLLPKSEGPKLMATKGTIIPSAKDQEIGRPYDPLADFMVTSLQKAPAHSGLFSSAKDVSRFAQGLLNPPTDELKCVANLLLDSTTDRQRTLGFYTRADGTLEHTGFTGCMVWFDLESNTTITLLTNQTLSNSSEEWQDLREDVIRLIQRGIN